MSTSQPPRRYGRTFTIASTPSAMAPTYGGATLAADRSEKGHAVQCEPPLGAERAQPSRKRPFGWFEGGRRLPRPSTTPAIRTRWRRQGRRPRVEIREQERRA